MYLEMRHALCWSVPYISPLKIHFQSLITHVVLGSLKSFCQVDHEVDSSLHLTKATALRHSKKVAILTPSWGTFSPTNLVAFQIFKINLVALHFYITSFNYYFHKNHNHPTKQRVEFIHPKTCVTTWIHACWAVDGSPLQKHPPHNVAWKRGPASPPEEREGGPVVCGLVWPTGNSRPISEFGNIKVIGIIQPPYLEVHGTRMKGPTWARARESCPTMFASRFPLPHNVKVRKNLDGS